MNACHITLPTRVLVRVLRSLLSLSSVILSCLLITSAAVIGRLTLAACASVKTIPLDRFDPHMLARLEGGDFFTIFSPNALFNRLVTAIPTPDHLTGDPGPDPIPSAPLSADGLCFVAAFRPPNPGEDLHAVKKISPAASRKSSLKTPFSFPNGYTRSDAESESMSESHGIGKEAGIPREMDTTLSAIRWDSAEAEAGEHEMVVLLILWREEREKYDTEKGRHATLIKTGSGEDGWTRDIQGDGRERFIFYIRYYGYRFVKSIDPILNYSTHVLSKFMTIKNEGILIKNAKRTIGRNSLQSCCQSSNIQHQSTLDFNAPT